MRLLACIIVICLYDVVAAGCEQQAAGSRGVGVVLGGIVVWLWRHCHRSQCRSSVDSGRGLVQVDVELGGGAESKEWTSMPV